MKCIDGYKFTKPPEKTNHVMYMDDIMQSEKIEKNWRNWISSNSSKKTP